MSSVVVDRDRVRIGERFSISLQRTLRIPEDDRAYPLPPGLGAFPIHRVEDYLDSVPATWRESGGVFIPMYQREALWLAFDGAYWKPNAIKVGVGKVNAVSGGSWDLTLHEDPQDYIVCPNQPWLDGINAGDGFIRQFVAMPLGSGYTVEAQVTGIEKFGGIQILVYEPKEGRFPDARPPKRIPDTETMPAATEAPAQGMGFGAGGKMKQKIYPDPHGVDAWDPQNHGCLFVHVLNSEQYRELTGLEPPPTPVSPRVYTGYGFPWFDLYDEAAGDVAAPERLTEIKTIKEKDAEMGITAPEDGELVDEPDIRRLRGEESERDTE